MNHFRKMPGFIALVCASVLPVAAMAESDFQVGGAVGIQTKQLDYQFVGISIKPTLQMVSYSLTTSYRQFFANVELETMLEGDTQYVGDVTSRQTLIIESKRSDSAITLGYTLWRGLSVFGGYKVGETESNLSPADGGVAKVIFSQNGPFAGISYGQAIGTKGSVSVSAAYASFDGEASVDYIGTGARFTSGGRTSGLSYGINWTGTLSESSYYRLAFRINNYKFKDNDLGYLSEDLSTNENYRIIGLSVGTNF